MVHLDGFIDHYSLKDFAGCRPLSAFTGDPTPLARDNTADIVFCVCVLAARPRVSNMLHQNELQCYSHFQTHQKLFRQEAEQEQAAGAGEEVYPQVVTIGDTSRARCLLILRQFKITLPPPFPSDPFPLLS